MNNEKKTTALTITLPRIQELIQQFETAIATYNGQTALKLTRAEFQQILLFQRANPISAANYLLKLMMDLAGMSNNEKLFFALSKLPNVQMNEVSLVRAILCGRDRIVAQLLTFPNLIIPNSALICAFYSTLPPLLVLQISDLVSKDAITQDEVRNSIQPDVLRMQFDCEADSHTSNPIDSLIYFFEKLSGRGFYCPPLSLLRLINASNITVSEEEQQFINQANIAIDLVIKYPNNELCKLNLKNVYEKFPDVAQQKLMFADRALARLALHFAIVGNDIDSVQLLAIISKPNSTSLNLALLGNVSEQMILHLLSYAEVNLDENTLHCMLFSKVTMKVVNALLERGVKYNENTENIMRYSQLNPEAIVKIARHCNLRLPQLYQTIDVTVQFYQLQCSELAAIMPIPAAFASSEHTPEGIPVEVLKKIQHDDQLSEFIDDLEDFINTYDGRNDNYEIKNKIEFALGMITKNSDDNTKKVSSLLVDYAAMVGDEPLFDKLVNRYRIKLDETTLTRAILCGSSAIVRKIIAAEVDPSIGNVPTCALFSTIDKDILFYIFNKVDKTSGYYQKLAGHCFHPASVLQEIFQQNIQSQTPERALIYFEREMPRDTKPISLQRLVEENRIKRIESEIAQTQTLMEEKARIAHEKLLQSLKEKLTQLVTQKQDMKSSLFFESEIHSLCRNAGYFNIDAFDGEIKSLFLDYAIIANSNVSFIGLTQRNMRPTVTTLNRAILCGTNKALINRILNFDNVIPDVNTLHCILMSDLPMECVVKIVKKGLVANEKTASVMAHSQQSPAVNELIAAQVLNVKIEPTIKTAEEVRAFYLNECPELVAIFNEPAVFSKNVEQVQEIHATNSLSM